MRPALKFDASASTDPDLGRADLGRTEALAYTWHFSDGGQTSGKVAYHTFADNGSFTATLTVTDAFGWEKNSTQNVAVANVTPSVTFDATTATSILSGDAVGVAGSFTDPGADAAWHSLIDWGNGTTTPATLNTSGAAITGSSTFLALGTFTSLACGDRQGRRHRNEVVQVSVSRRPVPTSIESPTINLNGNGNGSVALTLTTGGGVDVSLVDVSSIRLGSVGVNRNGTGFQSKLRGNSLTLNFSRRALVDAGVLTPSTTELDLTGSPTTGSADRLAVSSRQRALIASAMTGGRGCPPVAPTATSSGELKLRRGSMQTPNSCRVGAATLAATLSLPLRRWRSNASSPPPTTRAPSSSCATTTTPLVLRDGGSSDLAPRRSLLVPERHRIRRGPRWSSIRRGHTHVGLRRCAARRRRRHGPQRINRSAEPVDNTGVVERRRQVRHRRDRVGP